ncbi:hypothetical protein PoB_002526500 [Plakobranchus ocellatus]|uniref:Uncharacterized protein n=1 Tax=Plakobranchus ocellatus TaxID=259542 RepID=A0AAV3ZUD4_9GAST|nr:hypothetical protein PoB_002526500 [Plakobranchus ocellatus]
MCFSSNESLTTGANFMRFLQLQRQTLLQCGTHSSPPYALATRCALNPTGLTRIGTACSAYSGYAPETKRVPCCITVPATRWREREIIGRSTIFYHRDSSLRRAKVSIVYAAWLRKPCKLN